LISICSPGGKILVRRASARDSQTLDGVERQAYAGRSGQSRRREAGCRWRSHGRVRHHDHRENQKYSHPRAAWFDPATVRKCARPPTAAYRCPRTASNAALISTLRPGLPIGWLCSSSKQREESWSREQSTWWRGKSISRPSALHLSEVHGILGEKLETNEIFRILQQLVDDAGARRRP